MINEYFISKRLEISSEITGGRSELKKIGFESVMGYSKIIEELNKMHFEKVYHIMNSLIKMGELNKDFAEHIIFSETLDKDKFYEIDNAFNITGNNLKKIIDDCDDLNSEIKNLRKNNLDQEEIKEFYDKHIKKTPIKTSETLDVKNFINKEYNYKLSKFKEDLDVNVFLWLKDNIKTMSAEDYGMFLFLINKIRENE